MSLVVADSLILVSSNVDDLATVVRPRPCAGGLRHPAVLDLV